MNINIGDGFSAVINTSNQTVELDYNNETIITESIPEIEQKSKSILTSIGHQIIQFFMWIKCNFSCYSVCCRCG